jgi:hypothetical protein
MGELFDAIKSEAAKRPNVTKTEEKLAAHLGKERWKDFEKACLDPEFSAGSSNQPGLASRILRCNASAPISTSRPRSERV